MAPSLRSISEWTIDCGWTTTSIRSKGTPKRWCASIASKPLFIRVAESTVIRPPMFQVGCASASATLTPSRSVRPRNGPPDAVSTSLSTVPGALGADQLEQRRVLGVDRQQPRPRRFGQRHGQLAADHQALLVGQRHVDPLAEGDDRRPQPGGADDPVEHHVGAGGDDQLADPLLAGKHLSTPGAARLPGRVVVEESDGVAPRAPQPEQAPAPS